MISLPTIIGKGYKKFWNFKGRYCVVKGSRASKKSKTAALWHIVQMIKYPESNTLVIRKTERTLKDSCYSDLLWAIHRLGIEPYWKATTHPLELVYTPTGQKILFRGLDDGYKITSISVPKGVLNFVWIDEAYEITKEEDFDKLDEGIRGQLPPGYFKRITLTLNPWNEKHWIKSRFFDALDDLDIMSLTTDYRCNEWLDESDLALFERMKANNPRRYHVAGLGNWGVVEGLVYENFVEEHFNYKEIIKDRDDIKAVFGLDFGYTNDPTALFCGLIDQKEEIIYVFDELYKTGLTNKMIFDEINILGYIKEKIIADSAEPKSIQELRDHGLYRVKGARKGKDSINNGIQFIQNYKIIIHPRCVNFITEINNYSWDTDKFGSKLNRPIDDFNHLMDAMRYGLESYTVGPIFSFD
ncbi:PBSX family phage terminase large subunit [Acetobacterium wieringae]|uniref:PBSX family phage terminase large subunit n=1 Tax=Acetobacterium wieringae TaxID=52694 RepID=UPI0020340312|nr:PBSX family phage terminase large subunit [Acetobacterium wieringae]URN86226.1 PBSX family phage terminase large subunit [Acetobacterium wieringae]